MWFLVSLLLLQFCLMFLLLVSTAMFDVLFISYKLLIVPGLYTRLYNFIRQSFNYSLSNHFWYLQRINMFHYYFSFDFLLLSSGWLGYLLLIFVFFLLSASVTCFHFCFHFIFLMHFQIFLKLHSPEISLFDSLECFLYVYLFSFMYTLQLSTATALVFYFLFWSC